MRPGKERLLIGRRKRKEKEEKKGKEKKGKKGVPLYMYELDWIGHGYGWFGSMDFICSVVSFIKLGIYPIPYPLPYLSSLIPHP